MLSAISVACDLSGLAGLILTQCPVGPGNSITFAVVYLRIRSFLSRTASFSFWNAPTCTHQRPPGIALGLVLAPGVHASTRTFATPIRYKPVAFAAANE